MIGHARRSLIVLSALGLLLVACSSDDDSASSTTTTSIESDGDSSTTGPVGDETLHILVTNDDGVGAEGIDALVTALSQLPDTEVTVIAPAENQSGSSDTTTDGPVTATDATTASGYEATSVDGYPADSVIWALDEGDLAQTPDLVVSGINEGQNVGPLTALSGTVGAAREAARRGVPSLGVSSGVVDPGGEGTVEYEESVALPVAWVEAHRDELLARGESTEPAEVANLNVPTCVTGTVRGEVMVPVASTTNGINIFVVDCTSTVEDPADDVVAFTNGFASLSELNVVDLDALIDAVTNG
jgi:5'-nucleotidase